MSPYRQPPAPIDTDRVVFLHSLPESRPLRGRLITYPAVLPLVLTALPAVHMLARGVVDWRLPSAVVFGALAVFVLTRGQLYGSIVVGARSVRQVGFFRERVTTWEQLAEVLASAPSVASGDGAETVGDELARAQLFVRDRSQILGWTLEAAREGRFTEIAERVHTEGRAWPRWRWYLRATVVVLAAVLVASICPVLDMRRDEDAARRRAEVAACMASIPGTDAESEALRTLLCLVPPDAP